MADAGVVSSNDPRGLLAAIVPPPTEKMPLVSRQVLQAGTWLSLLLFGLFALGAMLTFAGDAAATLAWSSETRGTKTADPAWATSNSPDHLEIYLEASLREPADEGAAYLAAKRAVELDPSRASVWASLAYLETRRNRGTINAAALDALARSMHACPLCDQELIRWRFNFVLANWAGIPEDLRKRAFEHADLLRWIGPHAEFLAEKRFKARLQGIPFDAYRAAVDTPAKTWDIAS